MTFSPDLARKALCILAALCLLAGCEDDAPAPSRFEAAQRALARGDGIAAEEALRAMLAADSAPEDLAAYLGEAAMAQSDLPKARRWLGEGDFSPATAARGHRMLGRLEMREGRLPEAGAAFDRALRIEPDDADLWVDIGHLRYRGGEQAQAIEAADRALAIDPASAVALQFRGQLVRDAYGPLAALPWFERAVQSAPEGNALLTDYAATLGEVGRASEALALLREVARRDPKAPRLLYLQAVIAARGGNLHLARDLYLRADSADRETAAGRVLGGVLDLELGHPSSAAQTFDRLSGTQPDNPKIANLLAKALSLSGGERELVARFEPANGPVSPYLATLIGRSFEELGQRAEAASYLDAASRPATLAIAPLASGTPIEAARYAPLDTGRALRDYLRAMLGMGDTASAVDPARRFAERFPGSSDAQNLLGDARLAAGNPDGAIAAYRRAATIRRDWPLVKRMLAAQSALGAGAAAQDQLAAFLAGGTREPIAAALYARWMMQSGDPALAADLLDSALVHGAERDPATLALRSEVARQLGDRQGARAFAALAHGIQPLFPPAIRALAKTTDDPALRQRLERKLASLARR